MKKRNTVKTILIVLCIILLCVFLYSGYRIISTLRGYKEAEKTYTEVANQFATVVAAPTPVPVQQQGDGAFKYGSHDLLCRCSCSRRLDPWKDQHFY